MNTMNRRAVLVCVVLGLWTWQSHRQVACWQSDYTLWSCAARTMPLNPRVAVNLGREEVNHGHLLTAERRIRLAVAHDPPDWMPDAERLAWVDGWMYLYALGMPSALPKAVSLAPGLFRWRLQ